MKVVINRTDAIGDTILTIPMARKLKSHFTNCQVIFIVAPKTVPLFELNPIVDEYWVYDKKKSKLSNFISLREKFQKTKITHYFHVGGSHIPSLAAVSAGINFRGGILNEWPSFFLLNKGSRQRRSLVEMHESEYNINLLQPLGVNYHYTEKEKCGPTVFLGEEEKEKARLGFKQQVEKEGQTYKNELIFIHPGIAGQGLNWSPKNYARLIYKLENTFPGKYLYVLSFTSSDMSYIKGVNEQLGQKNFSFLKEKVYYFNGELKGLRDYMAVLANAFLFVGPNTGMTHLANIMGVNVVAIYSPIKVQSSLRWGPFYRDKVQVVAPDVVCGEKFECAGSSCLYYECMGKVEVDEVFEAVQKFLPLT
ncbi:glycosyltransferase family 9 protein [Bacteriovoracales bacterium]|nr:glycosyltransferase family 9 protein [Bacteriovoracales bacterium]